MRLLVERLVPVLPVKTMNALVSVAKIAVVGLGSAVTAATTKAVGSMTYAALKISMLLLVSFL